MAYLDGAGDDDRLHHLLPDFDQHSLEAARIHRGGNSMTITAWIFMGITWTFVIGLNIFCFIRIFRHRDS